MNRRDILNCLSLNNDDVKARIDELENCGVTDEKICADIIQSEINSGKLAVRPKKIKCEMLDKVNFMCRKYMDRMVRFEFEYDFSVDEYAFKMAVIGLLEKAHIFRSKIVYNPISPYWKPVAYNINDVVSISNKEATETRKEAFFSQEIPSDSNVQLKIHLFYDAGKTTICYLVNHMCVDGSGAMDFIEDLCRNYSEFLQKNISPVKYSQGPRDFEQIYADMDKQTQQKAKSLFANPTAKNKNTFPYHPKSADDKTVLTRKIIKREIFQPALQTAKSLGCTGNDLCIAAYMSAYKSITGLDNNSGLGVTTAIDLRRYIKFPKRLGYTNAVSFANCFVDRVGTDIKETLKSVVVASSKIKSDRFMGLYGMPLLNIAYKSMIYLQAENVIRLFYNNPSLSVSNLGVVKKERFAMDNNMPVGFYCSGAAKCKPCAVATISSFEGDLCISINFFGTEKDREIISGFYDEIENALIELVK